MQSSINVRQTRVLEKCSENNTYLDIFPIPEYPIDLIGGDFIVMNSSAIGDIFGKNRFGRYGSLCHTLGDGFSVAEVICKQNGFISALAYTEGSVLSYDEDTSTNAAFNHLECLGKFINKSE